MFYDGRLTFDTNKTHAPYILERRTNSMSYRIEDFENDPNWIPSFGEKLDMIHYRNGHWHAEIDPKTGLGDIHYDKYDPNESVSSLVDHMWESDLGKGVLITAAVGILDEVFNDGNLRKSVQDFLSD